MTEKSEVVKVRRQHLRVIAGQLVRHENTVLAIVLIGLTAVFGVITKGITTSVSNMTNILLQSSIRGVASVGQAFVILSAGIDVSVGGMALFCSILGASLMTGETAMNPAGHQISIFLAIPIMLVAGMAWGLLNGSLVSRARMPALIVTLAMWRITTGAAFGACRGGSIGRLPDQFGFLGAGKIAGLPVPVIIFAVTAVIAYLTLNYTTYGRAVYAVGGNPVSAWLSGINVKNILHSVYAVSGFLAGLAGVIGTARIMSASMRSLGGLELDAIAATVIGGVSLAGGRGTIIGVVIGTLIIGVINNATSVLGLGPELKGIVTGVIIVVAVLIDSLRRR